MMMVLRADEKHLPDLLKIEQAAFSPSWMEGSLLSELFNEDAYFTVAVEDERVLGFCLLHQVADEAELYQIAGIAQDSEMKPGTDPWQSLWNSIKDKKKFSLYGEKFERFLSKVCETYLELAKAYFDENMLIPAIGRAEYINIPEFKTQDPLFTRIKLEPMSEDINSMMGKTLQLNHFLQYAGN